MTAPATTIERAAKERPILFSAPMVRAILDGRKTQTRRIAKFVPLDGANLDFSGLSAGLYAHGRPDLGWTLYSRGGGGCWNQRAERLVSPFGAPGDRLWVRETWAPADQMYQGHDLDEPGVVAYRADLSARFQNPGRYAEPGPVPAYDLASWNFDALRWRPSIHMPRWASRISLEVTGVRVERLQAISEADAQAEGVEPCGSFMGARGWTNYGSDGPSFDSARESLRALWDAINGAGSWASNPWVWCVSFRRVEGR